MSTDKMREEFESWFTSGMSESDAERALTKAAAGHYKFMQAYRDFGAFEAGFKAAKISQSELTKQRDELEASQPSAITTKLSYFEASKKLKELGYVWDGEQWSGGQSEWVSKLQSELVDCVNELESYVNAEYPPENLKYPHLKAKYLREMESLGERLTIAKGPSE